MTGGIRRLSSEYNPLAMCEGPVIGIVAAVAGAAASSLVSGAILSAVVGTLVSAAINFVGARLFSPSEPKRPDIPSFTTEAQGRSQIIRSSVESHKIIYGQVRVSGPLVLAETTSAPASAHGGTTNLVNGYLHLVIPLAAHECNSIVTIYINDQAVTLSGNFVTTAPYGRSSGDASHIRVKTHLGGTNQDADSDLVSEVSNWTSSHRGRGICYIYVRLLYDAEVFPNGIPNISAEVQGKKLYDPRSGATAYSTNWALAVRDYLTDPLYGFGASAGEINDTTVAAAANISDESVSLAAGGSQVRYTANSRIDTAEKPINNLNRLVSGGAGAVTYHNGKFEVHAGAYDAPSVTIDKDWLRGPVDVQTKASRNELFNTVAGVFVDPDNSWQPTDFPRVTNVLYQNQDGGEVIVKDIELPATTNAIRAQRIAKILLEKARQGIIVNMPCNQKAMQLKVWDTVSVTLDQLGWSSKVFRIMRWTLSEDGGVDLLLQEESSASYDWASGEETQADAAPDTTLPSAFTVLPPGAPQISEALEFTRGGAGIKVHVSLTCTETTDPFANRYQFRYKKTSEADYIVLPEVTTNADDVFDIDPGTYDFGVRVINSIGVKSEWVTKTPVEILGLLAPPAAPTGLNIQSISSLVILRWTQATDIDVLEGGTVVFRHSPELSGVTWATSTSIGDPIPGRSTQTILPLKTGTYLMRFFDSSGVPGEITSVTTLGATVLTYANIDSITEHTAFSGTKTNCVVDTGPDPDVLKLASIGLFDDIADLDALPDLDLFGGVDSSATYDFAAGIDLGSVDKIRLESHIKARVVNELDDFDERTGNVDDWEDFDGTNAGIADCTVWVRETDDDPAGTPTWGEWNRLDVGEYEARGFDFQARLVSLDPAYNIYVEELSISADQ